MLCKKQQAHLGNRSTVKDNGQTWATKVISKIFELWLALWHERNGDRHGRDSRSKAEADKRKAVYELHQLYLLKAHVPADYQWILQRPIETLLKWPSYLIQAFLNSYKPIIDKVTTHVPPHPAAQEAPPEPPPAPPALAEAPNEENQDLAEPSLIAAP